jgi:hypothetical protein
MGMTIQMSISARFVGTDAVWLRRSFLWWTFSWPNDRCERKKGRQFAQPIRRADGTVTVGGGRS